MTQEIWKEILAFLAKGFAIEFEYDRRRDAFGIQARYLMEDGVPFYGQTFDQSVEQAWGRLKLFIAQAVAEGKLKK
jgi:hypothetical protein